VSDKMRRRTVTFPPGEAVERDSRVRWKYAEGESRSTASQVNRVGRACHCAGNPARLLSREERGDCTRAASRIER
jgi:hypothetical protein